MTKDIHKLKGEKVGKQYRRLLQKNFNRMGGKKVEGEDKILDEAEKHVALAVERSDRMKALNRRKKAQKHAQTKDLFSNK